MLKLLKPGSGYRIFVDGKAINSLRSDTNGNLVFRYKPSVLNNKFTVAQIN